MSGLGKRTAELLGGALVSDLSRPTQPEVTEHLNTCELLTGNADLVCEWSPPQRPPEIRLPIYPLPQDLPEALCLPT